MSKTLIAASARPMILSLLLKRESFGYRILQDVMMLSGGTIGRPEALLCPVLHRMEKEGVIQSRRKMFEENLMRKYYALTDFGRREPGIEKERRLSSHGAFLRLWTPAKQTE